MGLTKLLVIVAVVVMPCYGQVDGVWLEDYRAQILELHNAKRAGVNTCHMKAMKYDLELERQAEQWAKQCIFRHENIPGRGENIGSLVSRNSDLAVINQLFTMWTAEQARYKEVQKSCAMSCHYTQVVWANSNKLGCYLTKCPKLRFLVCFYGPGGNVDGQRPYTRNCTSSCHQGQTLKDGLCFDKRDELTSADVEMNENNEDDEDPENDDEAEDGENDNSAFFKESPTTITTTTPIPTTTTTTTTTTPKPTTTTTPKPTTTSTTTTTTTPKPTTTTTTTTPKPTTTTTTTTTTPKPTTTTTTTTTPKPTTTTTTTTTPKPTTTTTTTTTTPKPTTTTTTTTTTPKPTTTTTTTTTPTPTTTTTTTTTTPIRYNNNNTPSNNSASNTNGSSNDQTKKSCVDRNVNCQDLLERDYCSRFPWYMVKRCRRTCGCTVPFNG